MAKLREDPWTGDRVLITPGPPPRFGASLEEPPPAATSCPFCPGAEAMTPPEIMAVRPGAGGSAPEGWRVRVVPNKYPALEGDPRPAVDTRVVLREWPAGGHHEIVVEGPEHVADFDTLDGDLVELIVRVWRRRFRELSRLEGVRQVFLFTNRGREAGASLVHPHSQIVALGLIPPDMEARFESARSSHREAGRCLLCERCHRSPAWTDLGVDREGGLAAWAPRASRFPYQIRLSTRRHEADFCGVTDEELSELATLLRRVLARMRHELGGPAYNLLLQSAPLGVEDRGSFHWHLDVTPRTAAWDDLDGFCGLHVNPVPPEEAARRLRSPQQEGDAKK